MIFMFPSSSSYTPSFNDATIFLKLLFLFISFDINALSVWGLSKKYTMPSFYSIFSSNSRVLKQL